MSGNPRQHATSEPQQKTGCLAALARVYWMAVGNVLLFVCAIYAARHEPPSALDGLYAVLVALLLVVRFVDITRLGGQTSEGHPATLAHWRRYALGWSRWRPSSGSACGSPTGAAGCRLRIGAWPAAMEKGRRHRRRPGPRYHPCGGQATGFAASALSSSAPPARKSSRFSSPAASRASSARCAR